MWRAKTSTLIIDAKNSDQVDGHGAHRSLNESVMPKIYKSSSPFSRSKDRDLAEHLFNIVNEALCLGKTISKQVAEAIRLPYGGKESWGTTQNSTELQRGERRTGDSQYI